jgi:hypothetical protein
VYICGAYSVPAYSPPALQPQSETLIEAANNSVFVFMNIYLFNFDNESVLSGAN